MLEKKLAQDVAVEEREEYLKNTCDAVEEITFNRPFSQTQLTAMKESLMNVSIKISDIEAEKKKVLDDIKERMKPLTSEKEHLIFQLKNKADEATEDCYKFLDEESSMIGYYDKEGNLVSSRPAYPSELQTTVFSVLRKTGTNN